MKYFINSINFISKYNIYLYIILLAFTLFEGKIASFIVVKSIKKDLYTQHKIVKDLDDELIKEENLESKLTEKYNSFIKGTTYLLLSIGLSIQIIGLFFVKDWSNIKISMITLIISIMESRDNYRLSKKLNNEIDIHKIVTTHTELNHMANKDLILDDLVKDKKITEEEKIEIIRKDKIKK